MSGSIALVVAAFYVRSWRWGFLAPLEKIAVSFVLSIALLVAFAKPLQYLVEKDCGAINEARFAPSKHEVESCEDDNGDRATGVGAVVAPGIAALIVRPGRRRKPGSTEGAQPSD